MRNRCILAGLLVAVLALAAAGLATPGNGKTRFGPYDVVTDDHGSCRNAWAVDTEKRTFKVQRNQDGSFTLTRHDRGTFVTSTGRSPGACEKKGKHGATVKAGVHGKFRGYLRGRITGGTFDPNAACPSDCGFTDVWIATFFGPSATFSCFVDSPACKFGFQYHARHQGLKFHHWYEKGKGAGTFLRERFHGDVANA
jgi:hypothetical protein